MHLPPRRETSRTLSRAQEWHATPRLPAGRPKNSPFNPPETEAISWGDYKKCGYGRVLRTFRHSLHDAIEHQLPRMTAPTVIVRGERDPICRDKWARSLPNLLPNGKFVEIPRVAHTLCYTAPIELAEVTRAFIAENLRMANGP